MAFDPVPFFVGGGALHSAETARLLAYAATGGIAGVAAASDLQITQLPTAGTSVRAASGGAVIPNLYPGGSQQSYVGRAASTTDVPVTATGSGSGRVDLVIARIDDPQYGGTIPVDVTIGPYIRLDIIQNVAAGSTTLPAGIAYPAIVLARLDIPASTATITTSMITDLRSAANPTTPAGTITMFGGASAPAGYLWCNGASTLRASYPGLFAAIGVAYGSVDGTHFTVPNLSAAFPMGAAPGSVGGAATHTLTTAELASHNHTQNPHGHNVTTRSGGASNDGSRLSAQSTSGVGVLAGTDSTNVATTVATNQATGSGTAFSILPPYVGVNFIIKI